MKKFISSIVLGSTLFASGLLITGCGSANKVINAQNSNAGGNSGDTTPAPAGPTIHTVFGTDDAGNLVSATSDNFGGSIVSLGAITGLQAGEKILGVSFSPSVELYALGSTNRLYKIDTLTYAATQIGAAPLSVALNGTKFGFSYNPSNDLIRVTSDTGQNLEINATAGARLNNAGEPVVTPQTALAFASTDAHHADTPHIVTSSSSCNCDGINPTIYGIDSTGLFVSIGSVQGNPFDAGSGQLFSIGQTSIDTSGTLALTLPDKSAFAYAAAAGASDSSSKIYKINLATGASSLLGELTGFKIETFSVVP